MEQKSSKKWTVGIGFGPGLSIEGLLLSSVMKNRNHSYDQELLDLGPSYYT